MGFRNGWRLYLAILTPLVLVPLAVLDDDFIKESDGTIIRPATKYKTSYVILIMAVYWLFEVIPLPVTALIPILMFPMLGIRDAYIVTQTYAQESNMIFLTGAIIALGLEYCNLHRRIAIGAMLVFGSSPTRLLLGIMTITGFLACWMSSTTCVSMLVPVVVAIIDEIHDSPEIIPRNRLKSMSRASAALPDQNPIDVLRRFSSASATHHNEDRNTNNTNPYRQFRKQSSTFEHPYLVRSGVSRRSSVANIGRRYTLHQIPTAPVNPFPEPSNGGLFAADSPKPKQLAKVKALLQDEAGSQNKQSPPTYESLGHSSRDVESGSLSDLRKASSSAAPHSVTETISHHEEVMIEEEEAAVDKRRNEIKKLFLFALVYAANLGGTAILTTAGPNKILKETLKLVDTEKKVTFYTWLRFNMPVMLINLLFAWMYLSIQYNGVPFLSKLCKKETPSDGDGDTDSATEKEVDTWKDNLVKKLLADEYKKLGSLNFHQVAVGLIFLLVVCLWIFREPGDSFGWGKALTSTYTGDSTAAMVGVILLFVIPKNWDFMRVGNDAYEPLLDWKFVASKLPWGALLLLGSGFAIADAIYYSGLSEAMEERLLSIGNEFSNATLLLTVIIFATSVTEITSNVASAVIIIPVVSSLSTSLGLHPLFLSIPATVACSYSFMLPGAAPSNAMVFAAGNFKMTEMIKNGFVMNILCCGVLFGMSVTYGEYLFEFSDYESALDESSAESFMDLGASQFIQHNIINGLV